ncbi:MAG: hypothetical protein M3Y33_15640 [Actinomycetota bacterium]|nr:hypothetical protein [Actinomycetota bacterium]
MLWAQLNVLLFLLAAWTQGFLAKTHAKAGQTAARADLIAPVAKTANQASTAAATAGTSASSALSKLSAIGSATAIGSIPDSYATFGGGTDGTTLKANVNTTVGYVNAVAGDLADIALRINAIYSDAS